MKKKIWIFLITLLVVTLGGGAVLFWMANNRAGVEANTQAANQTEEITNVAKTDISLNEQSSEPSITENEVIDLMLPGTYLPEEAEPEETEEEKEARLKAEKQAEVLENLYSIVSENRVKILEPGADGKVTFSFAGDILFDKGYAIYSSFLNRGGEIENCLSAELLAKMRAADVMMVNNEFPYTDRGAPTPDKTYTFHAPTDSVRLLDDMGVDIVSLANNHASDYGQISLLDSFDTLEAAGIPYVGAGHNIEEAMQPFYFVCEDKVISVVSATQIERYATPATPGATETSPGVFRCMDPGRLLECIKEAKATSDFVILFIHWGTESTDVLDWAQNAQAPQYAEAGVDLIIGGHPHVLQEVGYISGVPIVYSLGNFWFNSKTVDTCIVTATIKDAELESLQFVPCLQSGCSTKLLEGSEKQRVINYMRSISKTAQIDDDGFISPKQ